MNNLLGKKFGRLTIMSRYGSNTNGSITWMCLCDCGNEVVVSGSNMKNGSSQSCGCLQRENTGKANRKHGLADAIPLYTTWGNIKARCHNSNRTDYSSYGGSGITLCDEWKNDFMTFHDWAIANGYKKGLTIERKDVNGNYDAINCTWITPSEQAKNRRNVIRVTIEGKSMTLKDAATLRNIPYARVWARLKKLGYSIEEALK